MDLPDFKSETVLILSSDGKSLNAVYTLHLHRFNFGLFAFLKKIFVFSSVLDEGLG